MRRSWSVVAASILVMSTIPSSPAAAQSPVPSEVPEQSVATCAQMTAASFPLPVPGAVQVQAFGTPDPAFPNPDAAFSGRFQPGDGWAYEAGTAEAGSAGHEPVVAIGPGSVLAVGTIGPGGQGDIVVLEHAGGFAMPASTPGRPYSYPAASTPTLLSVYAGIDPTPGLAVGDCVDAGATIGVITAQCGPAVALPCRDGSPALHLEIRLPSTADPAMRSTDWSVAGPAADSITGLFMDPQVMVDDGLREPWATLAALAAPCPGASAAPDASLVACPSAVPLPTLGPTPGPTPVATPVATPGAPTPSPTPRAIHDPAAALRAGVPGSVRTTCGRRTTGLVTGSLAAVDCHPDSSLIKLATWWLLRPADARFTFASRMRQYGLHAGGDCAAGVPGIQSKSATLSVGCFVDKDGRANLRFASRASCPAVYLGVLGTDRDIAALWTAWDESVGSVWTDPGSALKACRSKGSGVSAPPAPTNVTFQVHTPRPTGDVTPPYRLEVTWDEKVTADTTIEVAGVTRCPTRATHNGTFCIHRDTRLPKSILRQLASAPAGDDTVSWIVDPGWEILGGAVALDGSRPIYGIVARAVNAGGASRWVVAKDGNGWACLDCTY